MKRYIHSNEETLHCEEVTNMTKGQLVAELRQRGELWADPSYSRRILEKSLVERREAMNTPMDKFLRDKYKKWATAYYGEDD